LVRHPPETLFLYGFLLGSLNCKCPWQQQLKNLALLEALEPNSWGR
jgi:hypothetical protein